MAQEIKHFVSSSTGSKSLVDAIPVLKNSGLDAKYLSENERQSLPSEEPIDLRELFPTQCYPYRQDGITHFLDTAAEHFYLKQVKRQKGHYTQSVYESVIKHAAARLASGMFGEKKTEEEEVETFNPPAVIPVGYSQHRQENRLNFATDIEIELPSGRIVHGRSVDISPSGMQIKLQLLLDVIDGMEMQIYFPAMEAKHECSFGVVPYRLMKSAIGSMYMTLKLARIDPGEHPFDIFLDDFIENKKHRYRIDAEDSKLALTAKAWEYLYIKALPYLACFVATRGEKLQVQEIAISEQNKQQLKGLGNSMLSLLEQQMSSFRLNGIAHHEAAPPEIYAYRLKNSGIRRRLCAASWQFPDNKSKVSFLRAGINNDSFMAWSIKVIKLKNMSEQRSTELLEKLAQESPDQAESLLKQLNQYEYLFYLVDIADSLRQDPLLTHDESEEFPDDQFFDSYDIKRGYSAEYTRLRLGISKQRNEERYIYKSPLQLKYYGEKFKGHSLDLSVNGIKVALENSTNFQIRDTVTIDFVGFNKKFRSSKLKGQSYRIAAITRDGALCLTRDHRIARHAAAIFLSKLLKKNKDLLPSCTGELWMSTKSRLIESWLNLCLPTQALLMTRNSGVYDIPYVLSGNFTSQILAPFQIGKNIFNLEKLLEFDQLKNIIRQLNLNTDKPKNIEIYLSQHQTLNNEIPVIEMKTWSDFKNDIERVEYIQSCLSHPIYGCYSMTLCKVPRLEKSDMVDDMNIIRRNARHRLIEFENEYKSLAVILELCDITDIVLERYNLSRV